MLPGSAGRRGLQRAASHRHGAKETAVVAAKEERAVTGRGQAPRSADARDADVKAVGVNRGGEGGIRGGRGDRQPQVAQRQQSPVSSKVTRPLETSELIASVPRSWIVVPS